MYVPTLAKSEFFTFALPIIRLPFHADSHTYVLPLVERSTVVDRQDVPWVEHTPYDPVEQETLHASRLRSMATTSVRVWWEKDVRMPLYTRKPCDLRECVRKWVAYTFVANLRILTKSKVCEFAR